MKLNFRHIGVIGLGYVGLPLAVEFGKTRPVTGFDVSSRRVEELRNGFDRTKEVSGEELLESVNLQLSDELNSLELCDCFIVTVPTPIDNEYEPDLTFLKEACVAVAQVISKNNIVIFESTVFPGCTEGFCVPIIEKVSGLKFNEGFFCAYSPERINPGDKTRRLPDVVKVVSGSNEQVTDAVRSLYDSIIVAGTFKAENIVVAETAKVLENAQRDINIALMNEMAVICSKLGVSTNSVIDAAASKWNFHLYRPGLVGGHCIGVDPYYLSHKAKDMGYDAQIILAGRRLNESMVNFIADELFGRFDEGALNAGLEVLVLGITFKENCPDIRNSKALELAHELKNKGCLVDVYEPWAGEQLEEARGLNLLKEMPKKKKYDAALLLVAHSEFLNLGAAAIKSVIRSDGQFFDVKGLFPSRLSDFQL